MLHFLLPKSKHSLLKCILQLEKHTLRHQDYSCNFSNAKVIVWFKCMAAILKNVTFDLVNDLGSRVSCSYLKEQAKIYPSPNFGACFKK